MKQKNENINKEYSDKCETCNEKLKTHIIFGWLLTILLTIIIMLPPIIHRETFFMGFVLFFIILFILGKNKSFNNKYVINLASLEHLIFSKKLSCSDCNKTPKEISINFFLYPIMFSMSYFYMYDNWWMPLVFTTFMLVGALWGNKKIF